MTGIFGTAEINKKREAHGTSENAAIGQGGNSVTLENLTANNATWRLHIIHDLHFLGTACQVEQHGYLGGSRCLLYHQSGNDAVTLQANTVLSVLLQPNFLHLQHKLRLARSGEAQLVYDPIRRKELVLTPEELLRQLVVIYFLDVKNYPANRIRVEIGIEVNGLKKRCDILVFDPQLRPWLLVECKSPKVAVDQTTFEQVARYNLRLQAPFLAVTNGLSTFCCRLDFERSAFEYLADFPEWSLSGYEL